MALSKTFHVFTDTNSYLYIVCSSTGWERHWRGIWALCDITKVTGDKKRGTRLIVLISARDQLIMRKCWQSDFCIMWDLWKMLAVELVRSSRHSLTSFNIFGNLMLILKKTGHKFGRELKAESTELQPPTDNDAFFAPVSIHAHRAPELFLTVAVIMQTHYFSPDLKSWTMQNPKPERVTVNTLQTAGVCTSSHAALVKS